MLILKTLSRGTNHGFGIALHIRQVSEDTLKVGEGSLYPALQRLLIDDLVEADWGISENNRRARYYRLTPSGRRQLAAQTTRWDEIVRAVNRILRPSEM